MIIKSLKLSNIRSYTNTEINFSEGIILLSGDIGAGKSSVLLAIEFALFGVKRGETTGSSLLRHGKKEGSVTLNMQVDDNDVIIKRTLKRMKYGVKQDSGYIINNGIKTEGTAEELKAKVLELLGYPHDLLKKGKDLVYRYTVYTPQEQMKAILFESRDERLDTLRKVFGIDKYKRIKENSLNYISYLRREKRHLEGKTDGLDEKIKARQQKIEEIKEFEEQLKNLEVDFENEQKNHGKLKDYYESLEKHIKESEEIRHSLKVIDAQLSEKFNSRERVKKEIERLSSDLLGLEEYKSQEDTTDYKTLLNQKRQVLQDLENKFYSHRKILSECDINIQNSKKVIDKISDIDKCPTCEQHVGVDHKNLISSRENSTIEKLESEKSKISSDYEKISQKISIIKKEIDQYLQKEKNQAIHKEKLKSYEEKQKLVEKYKDDLSQLKKQIGELNTKKIELSRQLKEFEDTETNFNEAKKQLQHEESLLRSKENKLVSIKTTITEGKKIIDLYDNEIESKKQFKTKIKKMQELNNWMEKHFLNLMSVMEKSVMAQLYKEFNELFVEWFNTLIEDETLNVRLDDQFTPLVEQNGYDTELQNLSGGEKTSVALAYRLSLNKVINDFITHIKTKDIIILDEPTDGFSQEQLDNVRDVIEQINVKQVIIVSHESKVESFVDKIIRVNKTEGGSFIA